GVSVQTMWTTSAMSSAMVGSSPWLNGPAGGGERTATSTHPVASSAYITWELVSVVHTARPRPAESRAKSHAYQFEFPSETRYSCQSGEVAANTALSYGHTERVCRTYSAWIPPRASTSIRARRIRSVVIGVASASSHPESSEATKRSSPPSPSGVDHSLRVSIQATTTDPSGLNARSGGPLPVAVGAETRVGGPPARAWNTDPSRMKA